MTLATANFPQHDYDIFLCFIILHTCIRMVPSPSSCIPLKRKQQSKVKIIAVYLVYSWQHFMKLQWSYVMDYFYQQLISFFSEMTEFMKKVAENSGENKTELSTEERNLLSVAYKNVIGSRRAAWRIISSLEQRESESNSAKRLDTIGQYKKKIESELHSICKEILTLLDNSLIPSSSSDESKVFFQKM